MPLLAESIVHHLDPFVVRFSGSVGVRWYGVSYACGFLVAWLIVRWLARTARTQLRPELVGDYVTWCIAGVVLGGRLGHVLLYDQQLLWKFTSEFPFWGLLEIHKGGMASHGGIAGVVIATVIYARRQGISALGLIDTAAFMTPPGLMFGRLANWVNGELWGKVLPDSMQASPPWWSVKYPDEALMRAQTPEAYAQAKHLHTMAYAGDRDALDAIAKLVPAHYPNNFIQALTDGPMLMLVFVIVWWKPRHAGTLTGTFLIAYGILRNISEQLREPDEGVFAIGPVTLPMMVSAVMVVLGIAVIAWSQRAKGPMLGGVRPRAA